MRTQGKPVWSIGLGAAMLTLTVTAASAQAPVTEFGQLPTRVRVGETVYVTDSAGRQHKGMLFDLSATALTLESGGKRQAFPADGITGVSWRRPDPLRNGALIGMGVAVGLVGLAAAADNGECSDCGGVYVAAALLYAGMGAGIGVGIDALFPGKKIPVYKSAGGNPAARVSLSPILTRGRQGIAATLRF